MVNFYSALSIYRLVSSNSNLVKNLNQEERKVVQVALQKIKENKLDDTAESDKTTINLLEKINKYDSQLFNEKREKSNFIVKIYKRVMNKLHLRTSSKDVLSSLKDIKMTHESNTIRLKNMEMEYKINNTNGKSELVSNKAKLKEKMSKYKQNYHYMYHAKNVLKKYQSLVRERRFNEGRKLLNNEMNSLNVWIKDSKDVFVSNNIRHYKGVLENLQNIKSKKFLLKATRSERNSYSEKCKAAKDEWKNSKNSLVELQNKINTFNSQEFQSEHEDLWQKVATFNVIERML